MMQQDGTELLEGEVFPDPPRARYITPVTATIRKAALTTLCLGVVIAASGLLTWFTVTVPPNGKNTFRPSTLSAYKFGRDGVWFASVPLGWLLLAFALAVGYLAIRISRSRRAAWLFLASIGCCALSASLFLLVLLERSHVHRQIPIDLRRSSATLVLRRPETRAIVEKQLAGLNISDGVGLLLALVSTAACAVIAIFIAMKSRRPSEAASA